jgi:hypothetical protein
LPPKALIILTYSGTTADAPCSTMGKSGTRLAISSSISNLSGGTWRDFFAGFDFKFIGTVGGAD